MQTDKHWAVCVHVSMLWVNTRAGLAWTHTKRVCSHTMENDRNTGFLKYRKGEAYGVEGAKNISSKNGQSASLA